MEQPDHVAAVILAAGESRRFGSPKQLAVLNGRTLLQHVVGAARDAGLDPIVVVVPPDLPFDGADVALVRNAMPELGMSHSLRLGFDALPGDAEAAVILLGDQPLIDPALLGRIKAARGATPFVATRASGVLGPPTLVERSHFGTVRDLRGDIGLREVLRANRVSSVDVGEIQADVDTEADLARLAGG